MRSLSLVTSECSLSGRGQGHVSNFYIMDLENFATASHRCTRVVSALLRGNWQDFNWHDASHGPSAIAELLLYLSGAGWPRLSWKRPINGCSSGGGGGGGSSSSSSSRSNTNGIHSPSGRNRRWHFVSAPSGRQLVERHRKLYTLYDRWKDQN